MLKTRAATPQDLPALTEIYNHYIVHTPITFDLRTFTPEERRPWFEVGRKFDRYWDVAWFERATSPPSRRAMEAS